MNYHHLLLLAALVCIEEYEARKLLVKTKGSKGHKNYFVRLKKGVPSSEKKVQDNDRKVQNNDRIVQNNDKREKKTKRSGQNKDKTR